MTAIEPEALGTAGPRYGGPLLPRAVSPWAWLLAGILLQVVSNGRWIVAPATWVAPVGWLVFLERTRLRTGIPAALCAFLAVELIAWRGLVPAPGMLYYLIVGAYGVVYFIPFVLHRVLGTRLRGLAATLVFPSAWVAIEFVFHRWVTPYGSWFSIAYTQTGSLPLIQVAAFSGTAGISFLMAWLAGVATFLLRDGIPFAERRRPAFVLGLVLAICWVAGEARLADEPADGELVRVAGIIPSPSLIGELEVALAPVRGGRQVSASELTRIAEIASRLNDDLFNRTTTEAWAGARLVAWSETAGRVLQRDEADFLRRAGRLARAQSVDLILAYGVWIPDGSPPFENKVAAVSRTGDVAWEYRKAHPIVGAESPLIGGGDGVLRHLDTPYGRVGAVICHDLDFPELLRQAGRLDIDLMVGPSADWAAITPLHANMSVLRAIETGFSLFRPTSSGRSIAADPRGRTLMAVDHAEDVVVAHVPAASVVTVYGITGEWLAWACVGALIVWTILASGRAAERDRRTPRRPRPDGPGTSD
jgi:apolipoprotein N-acyltransferase